MKVLNILSIVAHHDQYSGVEKQNIQLVAWASWTC